MAHPARSAYWALRRLAGRRNLLFFTAGPAALAPAGTGACAVLTDAEAGLADVLAGLRGVATEDYTARWRQGHALVCARDTAGRPLAWGWLIAPAAAAAAVLFEWGMRLVVPPGGAFLWDFFTLPAARGRRLYPALLRAAARHCQARGLAAPAIYCNVGNTASRRGMLAAGYEGAHPVAVARLGPVYRVTTPHGSRLVWPGHAVPLAFLLGESAPARPCPTPSRTPP